MIDYEFLFEAQTGGGGETVICRMVYERDEDGVYGQNIESVLFDGKEVIGLISDDQYSQLQEAGINKLDKSIEEGEEVDE